MSDNITEFPIPTQGIADLDAATAAAGTKVYGVRAAADVYLEAGGANGLGTLDGDGRQPESQMPAVAVTQADLVDYATKAALALLASAVDNKATNRNVVTALSVVSGVVTVDASLGDYFTLMPGAEVTGWSIINVPAGASLMIRVSQGATGYAVAAPSATYTSATTDFAGGAGAVDVLALTTFDGGTSWIATLANAVAGA